MTRNSCINAISVILLSLFACAVALAQEQQLDLPRLVHPEVADRLSLTDQQRAQIQQLLIDRATKLAAVADDAAKQKVRQDFDALAAALLTDEQRKRLQEDQPSQKLMFQFREMKWDQVLSWFATQQELTLVMDRTPPGAFTYSDSRSYSASEALDLLNSVLMTRGFTLVRREKMLTVMELSDAIPMELVPRITLEQLPERGRFELVSVVFPLSKRPVEAVLQEVKPYLSSYGKALPLAAGAQLLVIETAGKMQTINELIAAVPVPQAPAAPAAPPTPVFAAYALGQLDPDSTLEFIRKLIPSENISVDGQAGILSAFVIPGQQTAIKAAFDALNEKQATLPALELVAYSIDKISAKELKAHVETLAPTAKTVIGTDRVLVAAMPDEQRLISESLAKLDVSPIDTSKQTRTLEVEPAQIAQIEKALLSFLPRLQVVSNATTGAILLRGTEVDLNSASELVRTWTRPQELQVLQIYTLSKQQAQRRATLTNLPPWLSDLKVVSGSSNQELYVWATQAQHEQFAALLELLDQPAQSEASKLPQVYSIMAQNTAMIVELLTADFPEAKFTISEDALQVTAVADPALQTAIKSRIDQLNQSLPPRVDAKLEVYQVPGMTPAALQQSLASVLSKATAQVDSSGGRLLVWAKPSEHQKIAELVKVLSAEVAVDQQKIVVVYPLEFASPTLAKTVLDQLGTEAKIVADEKLKQLMVTATLSDQATFQATINQMDRPSAISEQPEMRGFDLKTYQASQILPTLQSMWPNMKIAADTVSNKILATGTAQELKQLETSLGKLMSSPGGKTLVVKTYPVPVGDMVTLPTILSQIAPQATFSTDVAARTITALASEELHERISSAIEQIKSVQSTKRPAAHQVKPSQLPSLQTALLSLFPGISIASDVSSGQLIVVASEPIQTQVAEVVELLGKGASGVDRTIEAYTLDSQRFDAASFMTTLQSLVPATVKLESNASTNSVLAIGSEEELRLVTQQVDKLKQQIPNEQSASAKLYQLQHANPTSVSTMLLALAPKAKIVPDVLSRSIVATANDADHQKIATFLQKWDIAPTAQSYVVKPTQTTAVLTSLRALFPTVEMTSDATSGQVVVIAPPPVQERVAQVVQLLASGPNTAERTLQVFPLKPRMAESPSFLKSLQALSPAHVQLEINALTSSLMAIGTADELKIVQKQVQELIEKIPEPATQSSALYQLKHITTQSAITVLQPLVPKAVLVQDAVTRSVAATATAEEHAKIAELVKVLDQPAQTNQTTKVYQLKQGSGQGLAYVLMGIMPDAKLFGDRESGAMLATATEQQHEVIRAIVDQYGEPGQFQTRVFSMERGDASSLQAAIVQWNSRVKVTADRASNSLIVTASEEELKRIESIVSGIDGSGTGQKETKFYSVRGSSPTTLASALQLNFPKASIAGDTSGGGVFVTGTSATQLQVQQVIDQVNSSPNRRSNLRAFHIQHVPPPEVARSLVEALGKRTTASVTFNEETRSVFVVGIDEDHQLAEEIVKLVDVPRHERVFRELKVFPVDGLDGKTLMDALNAAFHDEPDRVELRHDFSTGRLYVFGNPSQLTRAEQMLQMLTPESRSLQVVTLGALDPYSAKEAVDALFTDTPYNRSPVVTVDTDHQRLLVKATQDQQTQIRDLLDQLGATAGTGTSSPESGQGATELGRIRVVPMVGNSERLLEQLRSVWPALSRNPLKIIQPTQTDAKPDPGSDAESKAVDKDHEDADPQTGQSPEPAPDSGASIELSDEFNQAANVVIVVGQEQWTLASEDLKALDQLQRVLTVIRSPRAQPILSTGNYSLYLLQRTSAKEMQSTLESLLKPSDQRSARSADALRRLKVVADERTNALIVSGSAADRQLVEELLGVLDSEELLGRIQSMQPTTIVLESANAERVEALLKDIYRSQLSASSSRRPLPIPEGVSTEVATLLQQLNAQSSGPLVTITADEPTNSIILRAPPDLTAEIRQFVQSLDQQTADTPSRRVELIRLNWANVKSIEQALRRLLVK